MRRTERGTALVESILMGLLFLVPTLWAVTVLADVHRGTLATTAAAREAGFDAVRSVNGAGAATAVHAAVARALRDHGLDPSRVRIGFSTSGLRRGSAVEVEVSYPVSVLRLPFLGASTQPNVWVRARHRARVDPYRSLP